ncbi:acylphosphatase [Teredinibacter purpureus]|uniref:acylphosphatase n=1 Tax=Teredinibacter purpureus TaxID=2731756 RepID=UPI0005F82B40|nr:acylphosphatase [Teredinibacter purpureus]
MTRFYKIRGRVQGVFFRAKTQVTAQTLGLQGWVNNCDDGSVEVVACGDTHAIEALEQWLARGPKLARVDSLESQNLSLSDLLQAKRVSQLPPEFFISY